MVGSGYLVAVLLCAAEEELPLLESQDSNQYYAWVWLGEEWEICFCDD